MIVIYYHLNSSLALKLRVKLVRSMVLKETMDYYNKNQSSAFCTFYDASKAFDRVQYCKLFKILIRRNLYKHSLLVRVLINFYMCNFVLISWCDRVASCIIIFCAINGVKQGGVRSKSRVGRNVMFCMQRYNCNVEKVCSGLIDKRCH